LGFYPGTMKNYISRIFTIPVKIDTRTGKINTIKDLDKESIRSLFKAILLNSICDVKTFVFFFNESEEDKLATKLYLKSDYVVAAPLMQIKNGTTEIRNLVYFADPDKPEGFYNTASINDPFFMKLFERDFYCRFKFLNEKSFNKASLIEFNRDSFDNLKLCFGLDSDYDTLSSEIVDSLNSIISNSGDLIDKEITQAIIPKLKSWYTN